MINLHSEIVALGLEQFLWLDRCRGCSLQFAAFFGADSYHSDLMTNSGHGLLGLRDFFLENFMKEDDMSQSADLLACSRTQNADMSQTERL